MRSRLSIQDMRELDHEVLVERCVALLEDYDPPQEGTAEVEPQRIARISMTIDEMPEIYRWFLQLWSYADHWTDSFKDMFTQQDSRYKAMREKRDLFEKMASAAKMRYEAASRLVTVWQDFEPTGMPRHRKER